MKTAKFWILGIALLAGVLSITSCESEENEFDGEGSHNAGLDCLSCHKSGGSGEGIFHAGGTVYKSGTLTGLAGVTVKLFSNPEGTGTPVATMTSDDSGNFYSKSNISFGSGLYARLSSSGTESVMISPLTTGACNSCHGSSTGKIIVQ